MSEINLEDLYLQMKANSESIKKIENDILELKQAYEELANNPSISVGGLKTCDCDPSRVSFLETNALFGTLSGGGILTLKNVQKE